MKKYVLISLVFLSSCTHKYLGLEPEFRELPLAARIEESKKFLFDEYKWPLPEYWWLSMDGVKYRPYDLEHVMEKTLPASYKRSQKQSWGGLVSYIALIPTIFFTYKILDDFNTTNTLLFAASSSAVAYGAYIEREHKNQIIREYNKALRIQFKLLDYEF